MDAFTDIRAGVAAETVTEKGFDLAFRTSGDTRAARARIGWIAIGELSDEDDWDVMYGHGPHRKGGDEPARFDIETGRFAAPFCYSAGYMPS